MPAADLLLALSQLAVALAGFSGLIAAIRTAAPDGRYPRDFWSLSWMLRASIAALLLSLLPLWLHLVDWSDETVYRISSAVAAVCIGCFVGVMAWTGGRDRRAARVDHGCLRGNPDCPAAGVGSSACRVPRAPRPNDPAQVMMSS
jgi:hypothetical protein